MNTLTICLIICVLAVISYVWGKISMALTAMISLAAFVLFGCLDPKEALGYFGNANGIMIMSMFVVAAGLQRTQFVTKVAASVNRIAKGSLVKVMLGYVVVSIILSQFIQSPMIVFGIMAPMMIETCRSMGFDAARLMITGDIRKKQAERRDSIYNAKVADYAEKVRAVREAVGDEFDLILECHRSMDAMESLAFAKSVEAYRPLFLEDPIPPDSPEMMADLAARTNIPIATGERFINIQEFETIFQKRAARYVRPDVCALGGLTPAKKVAAMAEANYCKIVPHNPLGPVSTAACLQLDAAIPNFAIQEFPSFYHQGDEAQMTKEPLEENDGYIIIPDRPGIGIELVDDICERFPAKPRSISAQLAYDGSVYDV